MKVKSESEVVQSCPTPSDPMDWCPPGSLVHGIVQERILEWVAISSSRGSSWRRDRTQVSFIAGRFFTVSATRRSQMNMGSSQTRDQTYVSHVFCVGRKVLYHLCHLGSPIGTLEDWNFRHPRKASLSWWHNLKYLKEMREPTVWIYGARIFLTEETSVQNLWNTSISWFKWNFHEHLQKC